MRAMTEIPAKTPSPMGRTDSFFPGLENAPVAELETSAAAAETDAVDSAAAEGTKLVGTEEDPLTTTPPLLAAAVVVAVDESVLEDLVDDDSDEAVAEVAEV